MNNNIPNNRIKETIMSSNLSQDKKESLLKEYESCEKSINDFNVFLIKKENIKEEDIPGIIEKKFKDREDELKIVFTHKIIETHKKNQKAGRQFSKEDMIKISKEIASMVYEDIIDYYEYENKEGLLKAIDNQISLQIKLEEMLS